MTVSQVVLSVVYLILFCWWAILALLDLTSGLGNAFFNFGIGIYSIAASLLIIISSYKAGSVANKYFIPILFFSLGILCFGVGETLLFYYGFVFGINIPFPSMSDLFYVLQFPFTVFGL